LPLPADGGSHNVFVNGRRLMRVGDAYLRSEFVKDRGDRRDDEN
jgi:hypothetical protein